MDTKNRRNLTKRKEFVNALMKYHANYYTDGGFPSIFSLQQKMIEMGICPRCGKRSRRWSYHDGHFPCLYCGFKLTKNEAGKIYESEDRLSDKSKKRILERRLHEKRK